MKRIFNHTLAITLVLVLISCQEDEITDQWLEDNPVVDPVTGDAGNLDLTTYVALGNSLTAGFTDGALYPEGQEGSYASLLGGQFALAGGGTFVNPNISSGNGFGGVAGEAVIGKAFIDVAAALQDPANAIQFTEGSLLSANTNSSVTNFGVPGATILDATNGLYGHAELGNPFFAAFASEPGVSSMLADAAAANPTFFSVWLGSSDVLGYATGGGSDESLITSQADFQTALGTILGTLTANGAKGIVGNVPPVHLAPYFQIVTTLSGGVNVLPAGSIDAATAAFLNSADAYGSYNDGLDAAVLLGIITQEEADFREITFTGDVANAPVITDESLTTADISAAFSAPAGTVVLGNWRQAQVDATTGAYDLFPLPALAAIGVDAGAGVQGVAIPLGDEYTLTMDEQVNVITAYATFNATIDGVLASFPDVALVDVRPLYADVFGLSPAAATGLALGDDAVAAADGVLGTEYGGYSLVPLDLGDFLFNSIFSADGLHPNSRGAALFTNECIRVINSEFGASILEVDVLAQTGINAQL